MKRRNDKEMVKLIRNDQNSQNFSKQIQGTVFNLKKDFLRLQSKLSKETTKSIC